MSVRRLASPDLQPAGFAFAGDNIDAARTWIGKYPKGREQSAVIPLLMLAQEQEGWVTKPAIEHIADMLGMPYIRALEVATFYTQFQLNPVGTRAHVQVCGTTPCMLRGAEALIDVCRSKIHHDAFHLNASGTLSWEEVECAGACVNAPMVTIFKDTYEDLTPERLAEIIDAFEAGRGSDVPVGPQNGRSVSAPQSGLTSLTDEKAVLKSTRDAEQAKAAATTPATSEPPVAPSNAAKPQTAAVETNPTIKSPSDVKVAPAAEAAASAAPPAHSGTEANKAAPEVEQVAKQRSGAADAKPTLDDPNRPKGVEKPQKPDDLQLITGIGPKNEGVLNSLGIYTFAQVAAWNEAERHWVDGYLNFKGRVDRENWVKQADALARGGVEEYVRVFGKKPQ
ncbi:MAG: NADH-quinone oxidoreductase subunit E [Rhizobiaceae bacterium]